MKDGTRILASLLLLIIFAGMGFFIGRKSARNEPETTIIRDTITCTKLDTFVVEKPVLKYSYIHDTVRTYFQTVYHDTVLVDVPIERKVYAEDSLYYASVSGWKPSLDTLIVYPKETTITITNTVKTPPPRWSLGMTAGPSALVTPSGRVYGGVGIAAGLTYNF